MRCERAPDVRVALVSLDYPPDAVEGVARQRQALARALVRLGHDVHVITKGQRTATDVADGISVHRYHSDRVHRFQEALPVLDQPLTDAQLLCEGLLDVHARVGVDVVDVPLWLAQPMALVRQAPCPVVVWLQTTLAQLVELQGREPRLHERVLVELDRRALNAAAACIADSSSILSEVARLYRCDGLAAKTSVVYPGIEARRSGPRRPAGGPEVVVVGRLEQRKGTAELFAMLPRLLAAVPGLRVRFLGRDNSNADGFRRETGRTYPEAWAAAHPSMIERVRFEGYVDDEALLDAVAGADAVLHPAHYESFGLVFLEAMRAAVPVACYATGGALEVFARGEDDGAVMVPPGQAEALVDATAALLQDALRRGRIGAAGRRRFAERFTSDRMALDTAAVYTRVVATARGAAADRAPRVFHLMEALQERDAVSHITRTAAAMLAECGAVRPVMSLFASDGVRHETGRLRGLRPRDGDAAIVHFWGFSRLERRLMTWPGPLALHYHNITPPEFFPPGSGHYEMTRRGYGQLGRLVDRCDLLIGDSHYNLAELSRVGTSTSPALCLYPVVDRESLLAAPCDDEPVRQRVDGRDGPVWLFVGRMAPNKRQEDVMRAFERFVDRTGSGRLVLVGDTSGAPEYVERLHELRRRLACAARIELVPSVPDAELRAWYRAADLFVCASQHEGFCLPLAEAMAFDVPIIALSRGAVAETVGGAGLLVAEWDDDVVAELAAELLASPVRRSAQTAAGRRRLLAFSASAARSRCAAIVHFLRDGTPSPLFISSPTPPPTAQETSTPWTHSTI